jgi:hypothetical protein
MVILFSYTPAVGSALNAQTSEASSFFPVLVPFPFFGELWVLIHSAVLLKCMFCSCEVAKSVFLFLPLFFPRLRWPLPSQLSRWSWQAPIFGKILRLHAFSGPTTACLLYNLDGLSLALICFVHVQFSYRPRVGCDEFGAPSSAYRRFKMVAYVCDSYGAGLSMAYAEFGLHVY